MMTTKVSPVSIQLKYLRHSARKLRPVLKMFIGKSLPESIEKTSIMSQDSARMLNKALKMAKASATEKHFSTDNMFIKELFASEGPKIKRIRPNSRGRTNKYIKHLSHLSVVLVETEKGLSSVSPASKTEPKKIETTVRSKKDRK